MCVYMFVKVESGDSNGWKTVKNYIGWCPQSTKVWTLVGVITIL